MLTGAVEHVPLKHEDPVMDLTTSMHTRPTPGFVQVRLALNSYYVYLFDEELKEDSALHEVHKHTGISKRILEQAVEQWESNGTIRSVEGRNRSRARKGKGKAPDGTTKYLKQYIDRENQRGRNVTAVECRRFLASEPRTEDESDASRIPVQVSHRTVCTWLHHLGYSHKVGKKGFAPTVAKSTGGSSKNVPPVPDRAEARPPPYTGGAIPMQENGGGLLDRAPPTPLTLSPSSSYGLTQRVTVPT